MRAVSPSARIGHAWKSLRAMNGNATEVPQLISGEGLQKKGGQGVRMGRWRIRYGYA